MTHKYKPLCFETISIDDVPYEYIVKKEKDKSTSVSVYLNKKFFTAISIPSLIKDIEFVIKRAIQYRVGKEDKKFSKQWPTEEGWYWIKYKGNKYGYVTCPAQHFIFAESNVFASAKNDNFILSPNHEPVDKSLRIGPRIPMP